jgi:hypothetical protein
MDLAEFRDLAEKQGGDEEAVVTKKMSTARARNPSKPMMK